MTERWNILEEIRDMRAEEGPIYSTFAGPEPDVWPVLEKEEHEILGAIILIAIAFALGMVFSIFLDRKVMKPRKTD